MARPVKSGQIFGLNLGLRVQTGVFNSQGNLIGKGPQMFSMIRVEEVGFTTAFKKVIPLELFTSNDQKFFFPQRYPALRRRKTTGFYPQSVDRRQGPLD